MNNILILGVGVAVLYLLTTKSGKAGYWVDRINAARTSSDLITIFNGYDADYAAGAINLDQRVSLDRLLAQKQAQISAPVSIVGVWTQRIWLVSSLSEWYFLKYELDEDYVAGRVSSGEYNEISKVLTTVRQSV